MGHVFSRPSRLTFAAIVPVIILWLAFAGGAFAATPPDGTIAKPSPQSTQWNGQTFTAAQGLGIDPTQCGSGPSFTNPFNDAGELFCDHYVLHTGSDGTVEAVITWPGAFCSSNPLLCGDPTQTDLNILVCEAQTPVSALAPPPDNDRCADELTASGVEIQPFTEVAFSDLMTQQFDRVTWFAQMGHSYEIRVIPFSVDIQMDYRGCAEYIDGLFNRVCAQAPSPVVEPQSSADFLSQCTMTTPNNSDSLNRRLSGGGEIPSPGFAATDKSAHFAMSVRRKMEDDHDGKGPKLLHGNLVYHDQQPDGTKREFKSQTVNCASFNDGADVKNGYRGRAEMRGLGRLTIGDPKRSNVCYRAVGTDNGQTGDTFEIQLFLLDDNGTPNDPTDDKCGPVLLGNGPAPLNNGNLKYFFKDGKDD